MSALDTARDTLNAQVLRLLRWLAGFTNNRGDQSMVRAVAILLTFGALGLIYTVYRVATRASLHDAAGVIVAVCGGLATVVTGVFGALAKRTKLTDLPKETT